MARRLNIERRRKRVRQYTARRKQRSPVRRALTYWWGTGLVVLLTAAALGPLAAKVVAQTMTPVAPERYRLPPAGLTLVHVPTAALEKAIRLGTVRRQASALTDGDIGLSLATKAPEPAPLPTMPLPPLSLAREEAQVAPSPVAFLPNADVSAAANAPASGPLMVRLDAPLEKVDFRLQRVPEPSTPGRGSATFWVTLDAEGRVDTVLREWPKGEETPWLRELRVAIALGKGSGPANGRCAFIWESEETP